MVATSRMRHRRDFQAAHQGVKVAGKYVVVHHKTLVNQGDSPDPVVGYVVSKKVGNAVVRNRVQRRLRHLIHETQRRIAHGSLLVILVLPSAAQANSAELSHDLDRLLQRLEADR
jgi:ribonuclease P protein component